MEYLPQPPKPSKLPTQYVLVDDITGMAPVVRGPQILKIKKYHKNGTYDLLEFKVPHMPKANCKNCHGKGYVGFNLILGNPIGCAKCYPPNKQV